MAFPITPTNVKSQLQSNDSGAPEEEAVRDFLLDIASRKEFRAFIPGIPPGPNATNHPFAFGLPGGPSAPKTPAISGLRLHKAQLFVSNFFNPNTPFTRLLLNWQTGTGKTIGAISIAQEYVRQYRAQITTPVLDRPTVFIIGFTKTIIQAEMLRHPEFGFVSPSEVIELRHLHVLAEASNGPASPESRHYSSYVGTLKRRITDRTRGGYYQFYGYKEFANRLFIVTPRGVTEGFSVAGLYSQTPVMTASQGRRDSDSEDTPLEQQAEDATAEPTFLERIDAAVEAGNVKVNQELLNSLRGGLIMADEIHNTYNIQTKNNYGVAIQYVLDKFSKDDALRAVFMSATVTGGMATEVVDLLNFLVPIAELPGRRRLHRSEFFYISEGPDGRRAISLIPGALDRIGRLSAGRVSFLLDTDKTSYPRRIFEGKSLPNPLRPGSDIAYLRFIPCPMTPFHERTLVRMLDSHKEGTEDSWRRTTRLAIPANAYTLYDMAYPNPEFAPDAAAKSNDAYGLYTSAETPIKLAAAPTEWKSAAGVTVESSKRGQGVHSGVSPLISGPFLDLGHPETPPGMEAYSTKYQTIGSDLLEIIGKGPGKIMIYHHRVRMSGVLQIQGMLEMNGLLNETSAPSPSTICGVCGIAQKVHTTKAAVATWAGAHDYTPARYVMINSEIDRSILDRSIARYNNQSNSEGFEYRVLIGSKIIREGFDLKAVRHQLIASLPTDIPTLIQVFGRTVRKGSHIGLPEDQRDVRIRIYISTAGKTTQGIGPAPEVIRYAEKMESYFLTQEVEKAIRKYAIDAFINHEQMLLTNPSLLETPNIDAIPYTPAISQAEVLQKPEKVVTFEAYGHGDREIETLKLVIRALFETQPIWKYEDLWAEVRTGRVQGVAQNPQSFSEASFALALDALGLHTPFISWKTGDVSRYTGTGPAWQISRVGEFYIRTPIGLCGQPILDVESYIRDNTVLAPVQIQIADYVQASRQVANFAVRLAEFETKFGPPESCIEDLFTKYDADFHYAFLKVIVKSYADKNSVDNTSIEVRRKASLAGTPVARAINLYMRFKIIVLGQDIAASPEAKHLVRTSRHANNKTPVGYIGETSIRLYGDEKSPDGWYDIPWKVFKFGSRYAENDIAVGYIERRGGNLRFKIRPPIHELSSADVRDIRSLSRGAVCETRPRAEQEDLVLRLETLVGGGNPKTNADLKGSSSADLCGIIQRKLLALEETSRNQKEGMQNGIRWFYLFNDHLPTVTLGH